MRLRIHLTAVYRCFDRHVALRILGADVVGARADQPVVRVLLQHVRRPARDAADGEDRREQIDRRCRARGTSTPNRSRRSAFSFFSALTSASIRCDISNQIGWPARWPRSLRHLPQVRRARILGVVDAVAEAGNLLLARELRADRPPRPSRAGASAPISSSSRMTSAFAPPCSGPLSAPIAADDRRVDVGERRRGDARGERRRVQLVVGVQDQRDVEGARREAARPLARSACTGNSPRGRAPDRAESARRRRSAGPSSRRASRSARSAGRPCGSWPAASCRRRRDRSGRARTSASAARPCRCRAAASASAAGSARAAAAPAASCDCRSPSSARVGSRRCHSR